MVDQVLDPRTVLEKAVLAEHGIRVTFKTANDATLFRFRCNKIRQRDRDTSKRTYSENHEKYGKSDFDDLILRISDEEPTVLTIDVGGIMIVSIEEINP